jgi:endoglucanase
MMKQYNKLLLLLLGLGCVFGLNHNISAASYNYGEVLQKAIYFYECQQSGKLPEWNRVEWRGDSGLNDYVRGGWYDAGDHVKFGLPMSATAGMLGWAAYEYRDAFEAAGQWEALSNNLRFVLNYFVNCHQGNSFVYQVGDGSKDHSWWGPVEVIEEVMDRPYYTTTASCVTGDTAASLAIGYLVFKDKTYLTHAKALFAMADATQSDAGYTAASGYYSSFSGFWDELVWAATWLYLATKDETYLTKAEAYVANLGKEGYTADAPLKYKFTQSWDDKHYGALLLLARITGKAIYTEATERYLDWWTVGYNGEKITYTSGGLAWLDTWGCLRYAANTAFLAAIYGDWVSDPTKAERYHDFVKSQINYILGSNPRKASYVVGFGDKSPRHPHHRTAHGGWCGMQNIPENHRHTIYGALVGGPNSSDGYTDAITDYTCNEVACDYNAGFIGALAKMCQWYGGKPLANFPPSEEREAEIFTQACVNNYSGANSEVRLQMNNRSGWPARVSAKLSCRYYVDLTEVFAGGLTVNDVSVKISSTLATVSRLKQYRDNIYYTVIDFSGTKIYPGGMNEYYKEIQFQIGLASSNSTVKWDQTNDYSARGLSGSTFTATQYIPVYDDGVLVFGKEPDGTTVTASPRITPIVTATSTPTKTTAASPTSTKTATVSPTRTRTAPVTPSPSAIQTGNCAVAYSMYDWGSGATVSITIKNNGTTAIDGWRLVWQFAGNQKITNLWNATYTQSGTEVTVNNESYNAAIPAGGSISFGFNLNYNGTNNKPTAFTVNGSSCTVD